jgi:Ca2+:H+ antiporter
VTASQPLPASASTGRRLFGLALWSVVAPLLALAALGFGKPDSGLIAAIVGVLLAGAVMAAVYQAEVLAHYFGEPFGSLILALAVTVIETSLIVSIMLGGGAGVETLARDTLIAAIMIVMNGIIGACLLLGAKAHHEQSYTQDGVSKSLAMLATLAVLTLVVPNYTTTTPGPFYSSQQLVFVSIVSLVVYATFVAAQTAYYRENFLHAASDAVEAGDHAHAAAVGRSTAIAAGILLIIALVGVVLIAKNLSPTIEAQVLAAGAPRELVGIIIAALVLAPEGFAAVRAARADRVQTSLNLALGSSLATIGLTIPAVSMVALMLGLELKLGLSMLSTVLLALTLLVASLTLSRGRTTMVQGVVHLVIFATYLFTTVVP